MVNNHELIFNDDVDDDGFYNSHYEEAVHNFYTPVESLIIHQMDCGPQTPHQVSLIMAMWRSLSKDDQVTWDQISKAGKRSIVTYSENQKKTSIEQSDNKSANKSSSSAIPDKTPPSGEVDLMGYLTSKTSKNPTI